MVNSGSPSVSIGMPVYNGERFIDEAIRSILAQTFGDFELLISDNASSDATAAICARYARQDPRIRYVRQASNLGAMGNFQYLLDHARGRYFMWAACDDFWDPEWVERLHRPLAEGTARAALGQVLHVDALSQPLGHEATGRVFDYRGSRWARRLKFFVEFEGTGKANVFYALYDRQLLATIQLDQYAHDYHIIFAFLRLGGIAGVPGVHLHKRIHAEAASVLLIRQRSVLHKIILRTVLPIDLDFLQGYFRGAGRGEKCVLAAAMPWKYLNAYPHMVARLWKALFSNHVQR